MCEKQLWLFYSCGKIMQQVWKYTIIVKFTVRKVFLIIFKVSYTHQGSILFNQKYCKTVIVLQFKITAFYFNIFKNV